MLPFSYVWKKLVIRKKKDEREREREVRNLDDEVEMTTLMFQAYGSIIADDIFAVYFC